LGPAKRDCLALAEFTLRPCGRGVFPQTLFLFALLLFSGVYLAGQRG